MRWAVGAMGVVLGTSLACGGMGADEVRTVMGPDCDWAPAIRPSLPEVSGAAELAEVGPFLELHEGELSLDGITLPLDQLTARLGDKARYDVGTERLTPVWLALDAQVPMSEALPLLAAVQASPYERVSILVASGPASSDWADPAYAAEIQGQLTDSDPSMRAVVLAKAMEEQLSLCPPGKNVFEAVAYASVDMRCRLMTRGFEEALPQCPLTDGAKVLTLAQMMGRPNDFALGGVSLALVPSGATHEVAPTQSWGESVTGWVSAPPAPGTWVEGVVEE